MVSSYITFSKLLLIDTWIILSLFCSLLKVFEKETNSPFNFYESVNYLWIDILDNRIKVLLLHCIGFWSLLSCPDRGPESCAWPASRIPGPDAWQSHPCGRARDIWLPSDRLPTTWGLLDQRWPPSSWQPTMEVHHWRRSLHTSHIWGNEQDFKLNMPISLQI